MNYEDFRAAVVKLVGNLPISVAGVDGADDGSQLDDSEEGDLELDAVGRKQADAVSFGYASRSQSRPAAKYQP